MPESSSKPERRDVVVVGGGVMGVSAAYQLARAGVNRITVLEAAELASGSSGKPLGGVRAQFSDPANVALGHRSLDAFRRFEQDLGVDIGFEQVGYLFAVRREEDLVPFEQSVRLQNAMGVPSRLVTAAEAKSRCRYLDADQLVAAVWAPDAGFARPVAVVSGYAAAAEALGVEICTGSTVSGIEPAAGGQAVLSTAEGHRYLTPTIICTAGAWSGRLAAMASVELPVTPLRRQIAFTEPLPERPPNPPFTIDYSTTAYFHGSADGGLLLGWADPAQTPGFGRSVNADWHGPLRAALAAFAPSIAGVRLVGGWAGLYEMTPDCNAVIGEADTDFRFIYAAGFSGHGFLQAPAVGECVRDLYLGHPPVIDIGGFDARRFGRPVVRTELGII